MRFPLHSWKLPLFSVAFLALLVAFLNPSDPGITSPDIEYVQRVVDGDTLLLGTGERVRLIGVDTPETKRRTRRSNILARKRWRLEREAREQGRGLWAPRS